MTPQRIFFCLVLCPTAGEKPLLVWQKRSKSSRYLLGLPLLGYLSHGTNFVIILAQRSRCTQLTSPAQSYSNLVGLSPHRNLSYVAQVSVSDCVLPRCYWKDSTRLIQQGLCLFLFLFWLKPE